MGPGAEAGAGIAPGSGPCTVVGEPGSRTNCEVSGD